MKRYTKFARTLPREHRNTPWVEFVPPVWHRPTKWERWLWALFSLLTITALLY